MSKPIIIAGVVLAVSGLTLLIAALVRQSRRQRDRVKTLVSSEGPAAPQKSGLSEFFTSTLPKLSKSFAPPQEGAKEMQQRGLMVQAGLYRKEHLAIFLGVKTAITLVPPVLFLLGCALRFWDLTTQWVMVAVLLTVVASCL